MKMVHIRLETKSCRISYRKLIVNNIRKVVYFFLKVSYVLSIFSFCVIHVIFWGCFWHIRIETGPFPYTKQFIACLKRILPFFKVKKHRMSTVKILVLHFTNSKKCTKYQLIVLKFWVKLL